MSGMWSWVRPPHHEFFCEACIVHDTLYEKGGTEADRLKADKRLYRDMVAHATEYFYDRKVGSQTWFIVLAYIYYKAVRWFGKSQFNYRTS